VPALIRALEDKEPLVRGHAAWALARIGTAAARAAMASRLGHENDTFVREELELALREPLRTIEPGSAGGLIRTEVSDGSRFP
jgi:hypothetical protein